MGKNKQRHKNTSKKGTCEDEFRKQKLANLSSIDQSKKGSIDQPIQAFISFVNEHDDFFTTSSCSGRICLFCEASLVYSLSDLG